MKTAGTLCVIAIALILSACTGQPPAPDPVRQGRAFRVVMGVVQQQEDYVTAIEGNSAGGVTTTVTDSQSGSTIQVPAGASIADQRVTAQVPAADVPRLGGRFT